MLVADVDSYRRPLSAPASPTGRLGSLDALRGLALLGVLTINLETEFRVSIFAQFLPASASSGPNFWIDAALRTFVDMKAFALFSLLFGVGLAIQQERLGPTGRSAILLVRRLLILLVFGVIHLFLVWNGDILTEYALAGLIALPFLFGPLGLMMAAAIGSLAFYVLQPLLPAIVTFPDQIWLANHVRAADQVYATGSFREVLAFRIHEVAALLPLHVYVFPRTLGLFLVGAAVWRTGLLRRLGRFPEWLWTMAFGLTVAGLSLILHPAADPLASPLGTILLALGYALLVMAAETTDTGRRALRWAEPVGRMAFTNYIFQSLILGYFFYGYGFGLFGKVDLTTGLWIALAVYTVQVVGSRLWLSWFDYGPLEWLWRTLMYGQAPPARST